MGAANIANWNNFDCVVTHTAFIRVHGKRSDDNWRSPAWICMAKKICTCESIIGFAILYGTTGREVQKGAADPSILRHFFFTHNFTTFTDWFALYRVSLWRSPSSFLSEISLARKTDNSAIRPKSIFLYESFTRRQLLAQVFIIDAAMINLQVKFLRKQISKQIKAELNHSRTIS